MAFYDEADQCIQTLERELQKVGETVTIQRLADAPDGDSVTRSVDVCAFVTVLEPQDLPNVGAADSTIVCSPAAMTEACWPQPPRRDDRIIIGGVTNAIEEVTDRKVNGQVVRYEIKART